MRLIFYIALLFSSFASPFLQAEENEFESLLVTTNGVKQHPINLATALKLAGAKNLDIQIAQEKLNEAEANHHTALIQYFPWVSPGLSFRRHDGNTQEVGGNIIDVSKQSYTAGATGFLQWDFASALYQSLLTHQLVKAADEALESQRQLTILSAANSYFDMAYAHSAVGVAEEAVKISDTYAKELHQAVEIGIAYKGDELRVIIQTERNRIALQQALEFQRMTAIQLSQILHLDLLIELIADDAELTPLTILETNEPFETLLNKALNTRPEIKQNRALIAAAIEQKNASLYGPLFPTLNAQAGVGGLGGGRNDTMGNFGSSEDFSASLNWRIGPGGLLDTSRIDAAQSKEKQAELNADKIDDEITRQVIEAFTHLRVLQSQLESNQRILDAADRGLKLADLRKEFAVGIVLEHIQAEQDLTQARKEYLKLVSEYNKTQFIANWAIGGKPTGNKANEENSPTSKSSNGIDSSDSNPSSPPVPSFKTDRNTPLRD
jgi:outer membrane protein TolC